MIAYMVLMDKFFDVPSEEAARLFYPIFLPALKTYGLYMMFSLPCVLMTFRLNHKQNIRLQSLFPFLFTGAYAFIFRLDEVCLIVFAICVMYTGVIVWHYKTTLNESRLFDGQ